MHTVKCNFILPSDVFLITLYVNFMYTKGNKTKQQFSLISDKCTYVDIMSTHVKEALIHILVGTECLRVHQW